MLKHVRAIRDWVELRRITGRVVHAAVVIKELQDLGPTNDPHEWTRRNPLKADAVHELRGLSQFVETHYSEAQKNQFRRNLASELSKRRLLKREF